MSINFKPNANYFPQIIRRVCKSVKVILRIIHANYFAIWLTIFSMCNDTPFILQFYSTFQVKLLHETAINSNKLVYDTFSF